MHSTISLLCNCCKIIHLSLNTYYAVFYYATIVDTFDRLIMRIRMKPLLPSKYTTILQSIRFSNCSALSHCPS